MLGIENQTGETRVRYHATPTALKAHRERARLKAVWGPVRSGKSTFGCFRIMFKARAAAKKEISLRALVLRDTYVNLRDTTLKTFLEWFPDKSAAGYFKKSDQTYMLRTPEGIEHEVLFRHGQTANEASQFLSSEYGEIFLEEVVPAFAPSGLVSPGIAEEVFDLAFTRLVQKGINNPEIVITANPPTPQHWFYKRIISRPPKELKELGWSVYFFPGEENKHNLRPGYYDELRRALTGKDSLIKRFVDGEIITIYPGAPVYQKAFSDKLHVRSELPYLSARPIVTCWDNPPTPACLITQLEVNGRWRLLKEFIGGYVDGRIIHAVGIREFAQLVKQQLNLLYPGWKAAPAWVDPSCFAPGSGMTESKTVAQILDDEGFSPSPGAVDTITRQQSLTDRLTALLDGEAAVIISRQGCPVLIEGLAGGYRYNLSTDGTRLLGGAVIKNEFSHPVEAAEYGASGIWGAIRPMKRESHEVRRPPSAMSA